MRIALLAFDGFDELEVCVLSGLLNRLSARGWKAEVASPAAQITSMHGLTIQATQPLEFANEADAVVFSGNLYARAMSENGAILDRLQLDPVRQLLCAQGSGVLMLTRLGLLGGLPACADVHTKPWLTEAGVRVLEEPFHAGGAVATASGGLAAPYLAAWLMLRGAGEDAALQALQSAAPVGEQDTYAQRVLQVVKGSANPP
jgi:transcriptional regulator GlxA family with amidase domain